MIRVDDLRPGTLLRVDGNRDVVHRFACRNRISPRTVDTWDSEGRARSFYVRAVRVLCGPCTTRYDTTRRPARKCPTCQEVAPS